MAVDNRSIDSRANVIGTRRTYTIAGVPTSQLVSQLMGSVDKLQGFKYNGPGVNPVVIDHYTVTGPLLNGQWRDSDGRLRHEFVGCPPAHMPAVTDPRAHFGQVSNATKNQMAWEILAKTNPSRPHVGVPAFIGELRDIPRLVKGYGDGLLKAVATGNLSYKFAIRPMISDLQKMCRFTEAVDKRFRYLRKLKEGKTLRTRCNLGTSESETDDGRFSMQSQSALLYVRRKTYHTMKMWGSAEYKLKPDSVLHQQDMSEMRNFARRLSAGITTYGALETAWELTPWSWFVDWFSNVGTMVSATNNTVGCSWGRLALMRTTEIRRVYEFDPVGSADWVSFDGWYQCRWQCKERHSVFPVVPIPLPSLPAIDGGKLSILLSLAALRR